MKDRPSLALAGLILVCFALAWLSPDWR
jgi:hypothetical protein